jgi:prepilin-type N-terminal cleavage/methylation domain-containing protein
MDMPGRRRRGGFTLIELLIVIAIIVVLMSAAAPKFSQYLMNARETAVMGAIRTVHTAQTQYNSQFGRFATTLAELGPPASGQEGPGAANLIPSDLATGIKGGFKFTMEITPTGYRVIATPVAFNRDGRRSFYSDQTMVLRQNWGADPATATSLEVQ